MTNGSSEEGQPSSASYQRPRTRQRVNKKPPALAVPDINDDAAERKRVLNVLAQRRYRERKRLGHKAAPGANESVTIDSGSSETPCSMQHGSGVKTWASTSATGGDGRPSGRRVTRLTTGPTASGDLDVGLAFSAGESFNILSSPADMPTTQGDSLSTFLLDTVDLVPPNHGHNPSTSSFGEFTATVNPLALISTPSPSDSSTSMSVDSYLLPMSELTLIRAYLRIADRLGCGDTIWDLAAVSKFCSPAMVTSPAASRSPSINFDVDVDLDMGFDPSGTSMPTKISSTPPAPGTLPPAWEPTATQMLVHHHPVLDFLPWATARDRIISIMSLPDGVRPEAARGPLALVHFVYDLEHSAEGMRVWGGDPYDPGAWEVGQVLFERWWFVFDRDIVDQSNRWRQMRGAAELRMGSSARRDVVEESGE